MENAVLRDHEAGYGQFVGRQYGKVQQYLADIRNPAHDGPTVNLEVAEDGIGFVPPAAGRHGRLGLTSMRERAPVEGWVLSTDSAPGAGARLKTAAEAER
jgi:nitrate/nitrite-specific signal transduction histidine kinase